MTRFARAICSVHAALFVLLAYCTVRQFQYGEAWAGWMFAAAAFVPLVSLAREAEHADEQQAKAIRAETEARRLAWADEDAAALARAELSAACCDIWWTSAGADHEDTCPRRDHRSAA